MFATSIAMTNAEGDVLVCNVSSSERNTSHSTSLQAFVGVPVLVVVAALNSLSYMLVNIARYEFICAQSPQFVRISHRCVANGAGAV